MLLSRVRGVGLVVFTALALLAAGCRDPLNRQEVSGTVTFKDKPLEYGKIEFTPTGGQPTGEGAVIENGAYKIPAKKGLSPGPYKVLVNAPKGAHAAPAGPPGSDAGPPPTELIPPQYNEKTTLTATVKEGGPNVLDFNLK